MRKTQGAALETRKWCIRMAMTAFVLILSTVVGCANAAPTVGGAPAAKENNRVVIYSSAEDYRNEHFLTRLKEQFPDYDIVIEYLSTGNQAAKLQAEGLSTECDISVDMEYGYYPLLEQYFADLSSYDVSHFSEDMISQNRKYLPMYRNGGAIIVNTETLAKNGLAKPTSYQDLLKPEYEGLVSMPNPKSSGTGYMFLKSLVNAWGEEKALAYFDGLAQNILQFTSSGSGPVNALVQGEAAIGLGMTGQAVLAINDGAPLELLFFEEGSPYTGYGYSMIEGKQERACVREVFDFFYTTLVDEDKALYFPEPIYRDKTFEIENFPADISYADMSGNTSEEKVRLLALWAY